MCVKNFKYEAIEDESAAVFFNFHDVFCVLVLV